MTAAKGNAESPAMQFNRAALRPYMNGRSGSRPVRRRGCGFRFPISDFRLAIGIWKLEMQLPVPIILIGVPETPCYARRSQDVWYCFPVPHLAWRES